jgi:hypothetical protein
MRRTTRGAATKNAPIDFMKRLKEISMFFQGRDEVHKTMRRLVKRLEKVGITYAVVGGMAVNSHRHAQTTADVDLLLTPDGFAEFQQRFEDRYYSPCEDRTRRFVDRRNKIEVRILLTGLYPGSGKPGPIAFPEPRRVAERRGRVWVVDLRTLIELKLAARRYKDLGDVVALIRVNNLDESFADRLHPSVRSDYIECLEEKRREEGYEARNG